MRSTLYVVSDLHLGGEPGSEMCSEAGRTALAEFFSAVVRKQELEGNVHLVLAGDIVDFLAEVDAAGAWSSFSTEDDAARKFHRIRLRYPDVWSRLRDVVSSGVGLTLLLGNHDVELCLPEVRKALLSCVGPGRVEFIYDNEAFRFGPVVVEHGNRYDAWNAIPHDSLRRARSRCSRREPELQFPAPPGSEVVVRFMNQIKARYGFVDLLKPETSAVLPILAALEPGLWLKLWPMLYASARAFVRHLVDYRDGIPTHQDLVSASRGGPTVELVSGDEPLISADGPVPEGTQFTEDFAEALSIAKSAPSATGLVSASSKLNISLLIRALKHWTTRDQLTWNTNREASTYVNAAHGLISRGAKVVIFGHTHLAKSMPVSTGRYLNSGTWVDLMRIPLDATNDNNVQTFVSRLEANTLTELRRPVPTFARVVLQDERDILSADVHFFVDDDLDCPITTNELQRRLEVKW